MKYIAISAAGTDVQDVKIIGILVISINTVNNNECLCKSTSKWIPDIELNTDARPKYNKIIIIIFLLIMSSLIF